MSDRDPTGSKPLEKDHKRKPIPVNDNTVWDRYAFRVECPHCGASEEDHCVQTGRDGPTGDIRSPHQERAELAREIFADD